VSTEVLLAEIAVAIRNHRDTPDPSCPCVLGLEALARERWRVWFQPCDTAGTLLYLVTLRSNCAGRSFDIQIALVIAGWYTFSGTPSSAFTSVQQLVGEFDRQRGFFDRYRQREFHEVQVASLPLPFGDRWDRLWVIGDAVVTGQAAQPAETLLVWQHGGLLFLVTGWNRAISAALGPRRERPSSDAGRAGKTPAAPRRARRNQ
jgi:hypothetical protein